METVPEKIFGYKILQESASQAKVPFEVGSFPVSLPGNLEMTANREKPEQLTFGMRVRKMDLIDRPC